LFGSYAVEVHVTFLFVPVGVEKALLDPAYMQFW
jgi:hypothetical protein